LDRTEQARFLLAATAQNLRKMAKLIAIPLDSFRDCFEQLGAGMGVTDPVSGTAVFELAGSGKTKPKRKAKHAKMAAKKKTARNPAKKPTKKRSTGRGTRQ
jgi:hypothetical protein